MFSLYSVPSANGGSMTWHGRNYSTYRDAVLAARAISAANERYKFFSVSGPAGHTVLDLVPLSPPTEPITANGMDMELMLPSGQVVWMSDLLEALKPKLDQLTKEEPPWQQ